MQILVLHNNYPAQFRHLLPRLVQHGHDVRFISLENHGVKIKGVKHYLVKLSDQVESDPNLSRHLSNIHLSSLHKKVLIAEMMQTAFKKLKQTGFDPNLIIFHSGWGMGMHLKTVFPTALLAAFSEWWFAWDSKEQNFDKTSPYLPKQTSATRLNERYTNLSQSLEICESDFIWTATEWQRSQFPSGLRSRINVFHEGVDTEFFSPNKKSFEKSDLLMTYTARGLEPMRGFDYFIKFSDKLLSLHPNLRVIIVGKDKAFYRKMPKGSKSMKDIAMSVYNKSGNLSRVTFHERLDLTSYRDLLRESDIHVYFSRPFVASWGLVEALSCGCCVVASDINMVREVVQEGAYLVNHTNVDHAIASMEYLVKSSDSRRKLSALGRERALAAYDVRKTSASLITAMSATLGSPVKAS